MAASPAARITWGDFSVGILQPFPGKAPGIASLSVLRAFNGNKEQKNQMKAWPSTGTELSPVLGWCSGWMLT